ncbi:hypothetical protein Fcan01_17834 [Folsomia candida]|uniref:Uncharacterized protein n=1 Tax=Folsomia candida TaxID=158441 RepID=A0A226DQ45_FOLCA|nr:hypothetical protein Fcan01_17834 [Folsomia candida]
MLRTKELFFILIFINSSVKSNPSSLSFAGFQKCTINLNLLSRIEFKLDIAENLVSTQAENMNYLKLTIYLGYNFTASLSFHAPNKIHLDGKFCSVIIFMEKRTPEFYRYFIKNNLLTSRTLTSYIFIRHYSFPEKFEWTHPARKFHWVISLLYKRRRVEIAGTRILMECPLCKDGFIDVPNFTEILRDHIPPKEWDVSTGKNILSTCQSGMVTFQIISEHVNITPALRYVSDFGGKFIPIHGSAFFQETPGLFETSGSNSFRLMHSYRIFYCYDKYSTGEVEMQMAMWISPFDPWVWGALISSLITSGVLIGQKFDLVFKISHFLENVWLLIAELLIQPSYRGTNDKYFVAQIVSLNLLMVSLLYENLITTRVVAPNLTQPYQNIVPLFNAGFKLCHSYCSWLF